MRPQYSKTSGQTLIEVIIAVGLVVMVLLTLVSALTLAVRNNQFAKDQVLARNRSREAQEWLRSLREQVGWETFYAMLVLDGFPVTYCLITLPTDFATAEALSSGSCTNLEVISGTKFIREMTINSPAADEAEAMVTVSWTEGGKTHQSKSTLILKKAL